MSKKLVTVVGARPQFVKAAVLDHALKETDWTNITIHTGQHYDKNMSGLFFEELEISAPQHQLNVGSKSHGEQTGIMLEGIEKIILQEKPDVLLVYGDTNSTLAGALAAAKLHIPIAHVEAGLRSFDKKMPEEINRVLTDHCSEWLFAPTKAAVQNLKNENLPDEKIYDVGDIMYDSTLMFAAKAETHSKALQLNELEPKNYILSTVHRAENTNDKDKLSNICKALGMLSQNTPLVLPLHPRTEKLLTPEMKSDLQGVKIIEPLGYLDMLQLERNAQMIVTDSGGVQKEAFFQEVPCTTLRTETEWVELIELGWNQLIPPTKNPEDMCEKILGFLSKDRQRESVYGDGKTAQKIIDILGA